ncbi:TadE/TadG family type IV pilus assembly protein [uncultured Cohaesibacter sp.]|uniref:TadE/TadG family type IV pilus assembly protein n=1 Tax=uncultured Cohaesibacter sp. TaxID=1002546 RepID=UPI0029C8C276|nr:TadE/TadG family type IV pilus assembly protein [uncultured Cohaesibacter sp.]
MMSHFLQRRSRGTVLIEFTLVAVLFFLLLFAIIEFSRLLFVWHALSESTRRAARLAAVCQVSEAQQLNVRTLAVLDPGLLPEFGPDNLQLNYLDAAGVPVTGDLTQAATFNQIRFVQARVINYQLRLMIPFLSLDLEALLAPAFSTTLPRESLGVTPTGYTDC